MGTYEKFSPAAVRADVVFFSIRDARLAVLLVRRAGAPFHGAWGLPGGPVGPDEDLDRAAARELAEQTGVSDVYLEQLYTFGRPDRDPQGRVISVAYYALAPSEALPLRPAPDVTAVEWFAVKALPQLAFDHAEIVGMAQSRLVAKLDYSTIAFQFMPDRFTLSELQAVYETILGEEMDKRNFRRWVLALERIEETGAERRDGSHRPARLYRLKYPNRVEIIR